ncbi:hypothetical protein M9Y10_017835 [Tritrichomonas musculus]|uniref:Uncharacterized protein n=1 Tax=Tritrichomonas musculus TaxID=1915356 RepID=A0ABR2HUM0_9EUKA
MGKALIAICSNYNFNQYLCHRQIIQHLGANSILGNLCRKVLKAYDSIEYDQISIEIKEVLQKYKEERRKLKANNKDTDNKIKDLEIMISGDQGDINSNYFYTKWALWIRWPNHVGRCSNHNESFHRVINSSLYNKRTFKSKLANLIQQTLKYCTNLKQRRASSIKRKVKNIVIFIINKTKNNNFDLFSLCDTNCNCSEAIYNEQIYGVKISCAHQILAPWCYS